MNTNKNTTGFFEETPGIKSSTRLFSFLLLLFFFIVNSMWIGLGGEMSAAWLTFSFMLLTGVFAPKYLHKMDEVKQIIEHKKLKPED